MRRTMKVDLHAHCYPKPYIEELNKLGIGGEGGVGVNIPVWESAEERIAQMDRLGVDIQVLNLSAPNVYFSDEGLSRSLAQMTNDFLAGIAKQYPDRFLCLAAIPLTNLDHAMAEFTRAIDKLGMDGIMLGTNINQRPLSDDLFLPFFEEVHRRGMPVVLHPMRSAAEDLMPKEDLALGVATCVGFLFETTRTIAQMTFKGTFERFPNLTFVLPHAGGAIPFICPRWDMFYRSRPEGHRLRKLPNPPSHYVKRHYYDTALAYHPSSLRCTLDLAGVDRVVFGTDHPYTNDFRSEETIEGIEKYGFTTEEKEKVFFKNSVTLFPRLRGQASGS
jgi:predicted TIM-barrel fold metal-dependent hydrolase